MLVFVYIDPEKPHSGSGQLKCLFYLVLSNFFKLGHTIVSNCIHLNMNIGKKNFEKIK